MHFLKEMMDLVRPAVHGALDKMKGLSFRISVQVRYTHPAKELTDMRPQYRHTGKRPLMNDQQLEQKLETMMGTILLRNAHFVRQSSGLVLVDGFAFRSKVCQFHTMVGLA